MLRSLVGWSLKLRLVVVTLAAGLVGLGVIQLAGARPDALPEIDPVRIEVQTEALGLSAAEVEQLITAPLEADLLNGVAFVADLRSSSMPGLSSVVLEFEPGVELYRARQLVQERLTQAAVALPAVSKPPVMLEPTSSAARVMVIGMSAADRSLVEQSVLARWTIRPKLMGVPGVANVAIFGERDRQLQVLVDPRRLAERGLTLADLIATTGNATWASPLTFLEASTPGTGGFIDTPNQRIGVRHVLPITDAGQLAAVAVDGHPELRIGDVASVVENHPPLIGDVVAPNADDLGPGAASGLMIVVEKFPGRNTLEVTQGVEQALESLRPGLPGIEFSTSLYRPAGYLEQLTDNVIRQLGLGLLLAALVIVALLPGWRPAAIAVAVVVVALAGAVAVLLLTGTPLNLLVMLGLAAGLAVVVSDALADQLPVGRPPGGRPTSVARTILEACVRTRSGLGYAVLLTAVLLVPALVVGGALGALLRGFALGYLAACLVALLVTLTLAPALGFLLAHRAGGAAPRTPLTGLQDRYARLGPRVVERVGPALAVAAVLLVAGVATAPLLSPALSPKLAEPDILVDVSGPGGTSRPEMNRVVGRVAAELRTIPGVAGAGAHLGRAILSDRVNDIHAGQLWVHLDPAADRDATVAAITETLHGYPGLHPTVSTYLGRQTGDELAAPASDLRIRVYGDDPAGLGEQAERVRQAIAGVDGLRDPVVSHLPLTPAIEVRVDLTAAQRFGLKPGDIRRAAATLVSGLTVGTVFERQKVFDVVVWGAPELRGSVAAVQDLALDLPAGGQVRLADVAAVTVGPVPATVPRDAASRYLDVVAALDGRGYPAAATDVQRVLRELPLGYGYRAELQTDYPEWAGALTRTGWTAAAAVAVVFLLLQAALRSWRLAGLAVLCLPLAVAGGAVAAVLAGGVLSLGSLAGLLAVLTVAAGQLIVLIRHAQWLEQESHRFHRPALVRRATADRLSPVLLAGLATAAAMLPLAWAGPVPGLELLAPMAAVVLGGLVSTTLVTLLVVPALYLRLAGRGPRVDDIDLNAELPRPREPAGRPTADQTIV